MDIFTQTWWHGSKTPLKTIDFSHPQGGLHLGTKTVAKQFGHHLHRFTLRSDARVAKAKDTGESWKRRAQAARRRGKDVLVYLNRIEGIDPQKFDSFDHNALNSMPDSAFLRHFPEATYSLLILRDGILL